MVVLISVEQLCKKIGYTNLLENINLSLPSRQVAVIFGPNGVGKSTLLKIISTLEPLTNGQILYRGQSVYKQLSKFRQAIGLVMHEPLAYPNLTARENLKFLGNLYRTKDLEQRVDNLLSEFGLSDQADRPICHFSRGMMQKFMIAKALLNDPHTLLLDEPFSGLDQVSISVLLDRIEELRSSGKSILMTTHNLGLGYSAGSKFYALAHKHLVHLGDKLTHKLPKIEIAYRSLVTPIIPLSHSE